MQWGEVIFLKLEVIKKIIGILILMVSIVFFEDVIYVAYGGLLLAVISSIINMAPNSYYLKYSIKNQILDLLPNILISMMMVICIYPLSFVIKNNLLLISLQVVVGGGIYLLLAIITKNKSFLFYMIF